MSYKSRSTSTNYPIVSTPGLPQMWFLPWSRFLKIRRYRMVAVRFPWKNSPPLRIIIPLKSHLIPGLLQQNHAQRSIIFGWFWPIGRGLVESRQHWWSWHPNFRQCKLEDVGRQDFRTWSQVQGNPQEDIWFKDQKTIQTCQLGFLVRGLSLSFTAISLYMND